MLAIRLQRTGRKGHAQFRVIVQDSHRSPSSGKVVTRIGSYDPHTKEVIVDKEKAAFYLEHGAHPSPRVAYLLDKEGVKLPEWAKLETGKKKAIKHTEKLRRNRSDEPEAEAPTTEAVDEPVVAEVDETEQGTAEESEAPTEKPEEPVVETEAVEEVAVAETEAEAEVTAEAPVEEAKS